MCLPRNYSISSVAMSPVTMCLPHNQGRAEGGGHWAIPPATDFGWRLDISGRLLPILTTRDAVPKGCHELLSCKCKTGCKTMRCKCKKANLVCITTCQCSLWRPVTPLVPMCNIYLWWSDWLFIAYALRCGPAAFRKSILKTIRVTEKLSKQISFIIIYCIEFNHYFGDVISFSSLNIYSIKN
jgi:hypothetical protein